MVCEITGGPSTDGKYEFALYWLTDYNPGGDSGATKVGDLFVRGQNFHCDMEWYMAQCFQKKLTWREVDRRSGKAAG
jgi:hypothetical protein